VDVETARRRIRERGETIRRREQARAVRRLEARRPLSERERRVIRSLAGELTERLLAVPDAHLRAAERGEADEAAARVALELFAGDDG